MTTSPTSGFTIHIPGRPALELHHLILDYNGTIACDGQLLPELIAPLNELAKQLTIHVLTADTHGSVATQVTPFPCTVSIIAKDNQIIAKQKYLQQHRAQHCVAIGNGTNDQLLLKDAALGIGVIQQEGIAIPSLIAADVAVTSCLAALDLLRSPQRVIATLRQ
ncbi:MAG: ATPase P [Deltaproteobacteria bacterium]|nr:ATPase P [Deltaproteobacteria bacterium]